MLDLIFLYVLLPVAAQTHKKIHLYETSIYVISMFYMWYLTHLHLPQQLASMKPVALTGVNTDVAAAHNSWFNMFGQLCKPLTTDVHI